MLKSIKSIIKPYTYLLPHPMYQGFIMVTKPDYYRRIERMRKENTEAGYTYLPFYNKQCLFVHIPKAAGVSMCRTLFGNLAGGHTTINEYRHIFTKEEMRKYFKFTFVRNPWDRLVSAFHFLKAGGMNEADKYWADRNLNSFNTFDDFVKGFAKAKNLQNHLHFIPQYKFICPAFSDQPQVDFIGYFENLLDDFEYVKEQLNISPQVNLKQLNAVKLKNKNYTEYYTKETKEIVEKLYSKDIRILGYDFENSSIKTRITRRTKP